MATNKNRAAAIQQQLRQTFSCRHLATELRKRNFHHIDYMTIDTEGSEPEIIQDFPWNEFDVRVVQIEQLVATKYPSQKGKKELVIRHMQQYGYTLFSVFPVTPNDTDDLIFVRNISVDPKNTTMTTTLPTQPSMKWLQQYRTKKFLEAIRARQGGPTNITTSLTPPRRFRHGSGGGAILPTTSRARNQRM
jgi:hypothetical protein